MSTEQQILTPSDIEMFEIARRIKGQFITLDVADLGKLVVALANTARPFRDEFSFIMSWDGEQWVLVVVRGMRSEKFETKDLGRGLVWLIGTIEKSSQPF